MFFLQRSWREEDDLALVVESALLHYRSAAPSLKEHRLRETQAPLDDWQEYCGIHWKGKMRMERTINVERRWRRGK